MGLREGHWLSFHAFASEGTVALLDTAPLKTELGIVLRSPGTPWITGCGRCSLPIQEALMHPQTLLRGVSADPTLTGASWVWAPLQGLALLQHGS